MIHNGDHRRNDSNGQKTCADNKQGGAHEQKRIREFSLYDALSQQLFLHTKGIKAVDRHAQRDHIQKRLSPKRFLAAVFLLFLGNDGSLHVSSDREDHGDHGNNACGKRIQNRRKRKLNGQCAPGNEFQKRIGRTQNLGNKHAGRNAQCKRKYIQKQALRKIHAQNLAVFYASALKHSDFRRFRFQNLSGNHKDERSQQNINRRLQYPKRYADLVFHLQMLFKKRLKGGGHGHVFVVFVFG